MKRPYIVVLLGGICAGKSTISAKFARLGAKIIDADKVGHTQLSNPSMINSITQEWGTGVLNSQGHIDRKKLAAIVFADFEQVKKLDSIVRPVILSLIQEQLQQFHGADSDPRQIVILDAPLASETGLIQEADFVVFIDTSPEVRRQRAVGIRQWPEGELEKREKLQKPIDEKRKLAHEVVRNNLDTEAEEDVNRIWCIIQAKISLHFEAPGQRALEL